MTETPRDRVADFKTRVMESVTRNEMLAGTFVTLEPLPEPERAARLRRLEAEINWQAILDAEQDVILDAFTDDEEAFAAWRSPMGRRLLACWERIEASMWTVIATEIQRAVRVVRGG